MGAGKLGTILHLIRHSEGEHKPCGGDGLYRRRDLFDPKLTEAGIRWCDDWHDIFLFEHTPNPTHILTSPMWRCVETACRLYRDAIRGGVKVIALSELQNWDQGPNGTGSDLQTLKRVFGDADGAGYGWELEPLSERGRIYRGCVDFSHVQEDWNVADYKKADRRAVRKKMEFINAFLARLSEKHIKEYGRPPEIAIVSHGSVLQQLTYPDDYMEEYEFRCKKTFLLRKNIRYQSITPWQIKNIRKKQNACAFKYPSLTKKVSAYTDSRCNPQCGGSEEDIFILNDLPPHKIRQQSLVSELQIQLWSHDIDRKENDREHNYLDDGYASGVEDENEATMPPLLLDHFEDPVHIGRAMEDSCV